MVQQGWRGAILEQPGRTAGLALLDGNAAMAIGYDQDVMAWAAEQARLRDILRT